MIDTEDVAINGFSMVADGRSVLLVRALDNLGGMPAIAIFC